MNTIVFIKGNVCQADEQISSQLKGNTWCSKAILSIKTTLNLNNLNITALNRNSQAENTNTKQNKQWETFSTTRHK